MTDVDLNITWCELCPRRCRVDRASGQKGYCRAGSDVVIFRYGLHHGEEPPVSGTRGSGTVFFSHCTMRCVYCQNFPWSHEAHGDTYSVAQLADIFRKVRSDGAHNWNLVSPTPWWPMIRAALARVAGDGVRLPVVCNTSGYERVDVLRALESTVDVYLTDLRYANADSARAGSDTADYVSCARSALLEMWRQKGALRLDDEGVARSGVICRMLVLPGRADEAIDTLRWLADQVGTRIAISVMAQYLPAYEAREHAGWNRRVTRDEYARVCAAVDELGFDQGWVQDFDEPADDQLIGFQMPPTHRPDLPG